VKAELRNYANRAGDGWQAEDTRPSVPLTVCNCQEDLLAFLTADLPTETLVNTEADAAAANIGHRPGTENAEPNMLRNKSIAALKQQISDLNISADDELFKSSYLKLVLLRLQIRTS
jgi:hypothetical protein